MDALFWTVPRDSKSVTWVAAPRVLTGIETRGSQAELDGLPSMPPHLSVGWMPGEGVYQPGRRTFDIGCLRVEVWREGGKKRPRRDKDEFRGMMARTPSVLLGHFAISLTRRLFPPSGTRPVYEQAVSIRLSRILYVLLTLPSQNKEFILFLRGVLPWDKRTTDLHLVVPLHPVL